MFVYALKSLSLCSQGRLRGGKTLGESAYEPPAVSLWRGRRAAPAKAVALFSSFITLI
jgi:hypothetical protein